MELTSAAAAGGIDGKVILDWCFVIGSLDLAVFGFVYSVYASAMFAGPHPPPIVGLLRWFGRLLASVLVVLTCLAAYTCYRIAAPFEAWIVMGCLAAVVGFSVVLAFFMH
ncbi:hypothetical protein [Sphingomonas sp.]|uniref:Uncharacterized protein n=1 Tax=Variovorax paradoxus TaxID=34073 RepID=A0A2W5QH76_VARPD|nr:hypothetical protein [Sphingomonas sp.]PZQ76394.1 MAG: hypothetical protein DI563_07135 [Variovorax paradoxus]